MVLAAPLPARNGAAATGAFAAAPAEVPAPPLGAAAAVDFVTLLVEGVFAGTTLGAPFTARTVVRAGTTFFADVAFFTAMLGPFNRGTASYRKCGRWREDKAFPLRTQVRNAATVGLALRQAEASRHERAPTSSPPPVRASVPSESVVLLIVPAIALRVT